MVTGCRNAELLGSSTARKQTKDGQWPGPRSGARWPGRGCPRGADGGEFPPCRCLLDPSSSGAAVAPSFLLGTTVDAARVAIVRTSASFHTMLTNPPR